MAMEKLKREARQGIKDYMLAEFRRGVFIFVYESDLYARLEEHARGRLREKAIASAYLPGRWFIFPAWSHHWQCGIASLGSSKDRNLWGTIFEINAEQLAALDSQATWNGVTYNRIQLHELHTADNKPFADHVYTYVAIAQGNGEFKPNAAYLSSIKESAIAYSLPSEHVDAIDAMMAVPDEMGEGVQGGESTHARRH